MHQKNMGKSFLGIFFFFLRKGMGEWGGGGAPIPLKWYQNVHNCDTEVCVLAIALVEECILEVVYWHGLQGVGQYMTKF